MIRIHLLHLCVIELVKLALRPTKTIYFSSVQPFILQQVTSPQLESSVIFERSVQKMA
jgi:hypothetical protein